MAHRRLLAADCAAVPCLAPWMRGSRSEEWHARFRAEPGAGLRRTLTRRAARFARIPPPQSAQADFALVQRRIHSLWTGGRPLRCPSRQDRVRILDERRRWPARFTWMQPPQCAKADFAQWLPRLQSPVGQENEKRGADPAPLFCFHPMACPAATRPGPPRPLRPPGTAGTRSRTAPGGRSPRACPRRRSRRTRSPPGTRPRGSHP